MHVTLVTVALLTCSNVFMTFAWYAHLRNFRDKPWYVAAIISWLIALFEYLLQVPANRIGYRELSVSQLKIIQEVITLSVFCGFAMFYLGERIKWNHVAAFFCILAAVAFTFLPGDKTAEPVPTITAPTQ